MKSVYFWGGLLCLVLVAGMASELSRTTRLLAAEGGTAAATPATEQPGEKKPSEDTEVKDFHSLGKIGGHEMIFRSACPVKDLLIKSSAEPTDAAAQNAIEKQRAVARLKHLHDLGIQTIVSFEDPTKGSSKSNGEKNSKPNAETATVELETAAAPDAGITFISLPMRNSGKNSLEDMSDEAVWKLLDSVSDQIMKAAQTGGVLFHCSAGHDRTGIVAAYMRMKYDHWSADKAIAEMRDNGHNWPKFSKNGGQSSWNEDHLRGIERLMQQESNGEATGQKHP